MTLSADGASVSRLPTSGAVSTTGDGAATAFVRGTASDLVLGLYDRIPFDSLQLGGDRGVIDRLRNWDM